MERARVTQPPSPGEPSPTQSRGNNSGERSRNKTHESPTIRNESAVTPRTLSRSQRSRDAIWRVAYIVPSQRTQVGQTQTLLLHLISEGFSVMPPGVQRRPQVRRCQRRKRKGRRDPRRSNGSCMPYRRQNLQVSIMTLNADGGTPTQKRPPNDPSWRGLGPKSRVPAALCPHLVML